MPRYRKKPITIEAMQLSRYNTLEIMNWIGEPALGLTQTFEDGINISTPEGTHHARYGDYIIQGVHGEFYPCKPEIFEQTYERVE